MGWVVLRRGVLAFFCLVLAFPALADEGIILIGPSGALYKLEKKQGRHVWTRTNEGALSSDTFRRETGTVRTVGGETQVDDTGPRATVRATADGQWAGTIPLPRLAEGERYVTAHRDLAGNYYVQLADSAAFAFFPKDRSFQLAPDETGLAGRSIDQLVPNPFGEGIFAVTKQGEELELLLPPRDSTDGFRSSKWLVRAFLGGAIEKLALGEVGGKTVLVALSQDGKTAILGLELQGPPPPDVTAVAITVPADAGNGSMRLVSSFESRAGERVRTARLLVSGTGTPARGTSTALAIIPQPAAEDTVQARQGRLVRVSADGSVVPEPARSLGRLGGEDDALKPFLRAVRRVITDDVLLDRHFKRETPIIGRRDEAERAFEILVRTSGNHPLLIGEVGTGRTVMGTLIARLIASNQISQARRFQDVLKNAIVVETTGGKLDNVGAGAFFHGVKAAEAKLNRKILVVINRMHELSPGVFATVKTVLENDPSLLCIGLLTPSQYTMLAQKDAELTKVFEPVPLKPFTEAEIRQILNESVVPSLATTYASRKGNATILPEAVEVAIRRGRQLYPELGSPEAERKLLEAMTVRAHRDAGADAVPVLNQDAARKFVKSRLELPFDVDNPDEFHAAIEGYRAELKDIVVEQERIIDWIVNNYRDIMRPSALVRHRSVMLAGPTGSGKTFIMKTAFERFFGKDRVLVIDCTKYLEKEALTTLLGSWPGYIGSDKPGVLPAFMAGRGRFLSGIIFDEWDKASPELANAIMQLLAEGRITDSSGKEYVLGTSMIGFTTNKGTEKFFPRDGSLTRAEQLRRANEATSQDVKEAFLQPDPNNRYDRTKEHKPENMRRIDAAFYTLPPSPEGVLKILKKLTLKKLRAEKGIAIEVDDAILEELVRRRYRPENGAPEVERLLTELVNDAYSPYAAILERAAEGARPALTLRWVSATDDAPARVIASIGSGAADQSLAPAFTRADANPLENAETRAKMKGLAGEMEKRVFGQPQAVRAAAGAVANQRYFNPDPSRPSVLAFLGPTGTGKSELAEVIAEVEFGSRKRCKSFQMGNIKNMADVDNLFGTARGRGGSDSDAEFEGFVRQYEKEGGVLHFEEMGNVGADDPRTREAVFRILYSVLLGKWTNAMGQTFDTSKFIVVFSSNEGQELFRDAPSDDLRLASYHRYNKQEFLRQLLLKAGWPEPLIARLQNNLILFKPLLAQDRAAIARKFVDEVVKKLQRRYPIQLELDERFFLQAGELFFTHETGARHMKDFAEKEFETILREAIVRIYDEYDGAGTAVLRKCRLSMRLTDNYDGRYYYVGPQPDVRKVMLYLRVTSTESGHSFENELEVTQAAAERRLPSRRSLFRTAYHEAGHVVANDPRRTGVKIEHVTIIGKGNYGGYARWGELAPKGPISREEAVAKIGMFLAGRESEILAGLPADAGWSRDLEMARELAVACVSRYGLTDQALHLPLTHEGKVDFSKDAVQGEIAKLLTEGREFARARLTEHWPAIRLMTQRLLKDQFLEEAAINEILAITSDDEYRQKLRADRHRRPHAPRCDQRLTAKGEG